MASVRVLSLALALLALAVALLACAAPAAAVSTRLSAMATKANPQAALVEMDAEADADAEVDAEADADADAELDAEADVDADADAEAEAEMEAETEAEAEVEAEVESKSVQLPMKLAPAFHPYAHGGAQGLASAFVADRSWVGVLAGLPQGLGGMANEFNWLEYQLIPNLRKAKAPAEVAKALTALQQRMQHNPVLAAYAMLMHQRACAGSDKAAPSACATPLRLELGVWLSPSKPGDVSQSKVARGGAFAAPAATASTKAWTDKLEVTDAPTVAAWMEVFGRAINIGRSWIADKQTAAEAIKLASSYLAAPGGVQLNIQSGWSKAADIDALIASLKKSYGINVVGVSSFVHSQLGGVKGAPVTYLFHSHFAVQDAAEANAIPNGATVALNGGSLLRTYNSKSRTTWLLDTNEFADLGTAMMNKQLRVGLYVQEDACHPDAVFQLVKAVSDNPTIVKAGLAYGNLANQGDEYATGDCRGAQASIISAEQAKLIAGRAKRGAGSLIKKIGGK